jgi:hypothetical protein
MQNKKITALTLFLVAICILTLWALQPQSPKQHYPLYDEITAIKDRLSITITEPSFTNPVRECDFYELREEDSGDYFQTTVDYWVFQHGQEEHGDIEAYVEIYNEPDRTDLFTIEIARFCWNELTVSFDGYTVDVFPTITSDGFNPGYITFKVKPASTVNIGLFYYTWYDTTKDESWDESKIVDTPILGLYDSSNSTVIKQHLQFIENLGPDFLILSWWGTQDGYGKFRDNVAKQVLSLAQQTKSFLKFAIMVEPFNNDGVYDYAAIYDYIYNEFAAPFPYLYYKEEKPLICFFNDPDNSPGLTPNGTIPQDERFTTKIVGTQPYVQWIYTDLNYYTEPTKNPYTDQTSVTPRYDDRNNTERDRHCIVDANLTEGIYDIEWENAINLLKEGKINTITITSWNEYPERTAIEPHLDATADNLDPWYLYLKTKTYIMEARKIVK